MTSPRAKSPDVSKFSFYKGSSRSLLIERTGLSDEEFVKRFIYRLRKHLDEHVDKLLCFCREGVQVEGWLKGELLYFLDSDGKSENYVFHREKTFGLGRKKIDFALDIGSDNKQRLWVEVKHWLIGYQKETPWRARTYFSDKSPVGIKPDVEKLNLTPEGSKFMLILATANPDAEDWELGIEKFNNKFAPLRLRALTNPKDFPKSYFLGLLAI